MKQNSQRCSFRHPKYSRRNSSRLYVHDGSDQCWLQVNNITGSRYCNLHKPYNKFKFTTRSIETSKLIKRIVNSAGVAVDKEVFFVGCGFDSGNFKNLTIKNKVVFQKCIFNCKVDFSQSKIYEEIHFIDCIFNFEFEFVNSFITNSRGLKFIRCQFNLGCVLNKVNLCIEFHECKVFNTLYLEEINTKSSYDSPIRITSSTVHNFVVNNINTNEYLELNSSSFFGQFLLNNSRFSFLDITGSIFEEIFEMTNCRVEVFQSRGDTKVKGKMFLSSGEARRIILNKCTFCDNLTISGTILDSVNFSGSKFLSDAIFDKLTFTGSVDFHGALFSNELSFYKSKFLGPTRFEGGTFNGKTYFTRAEFQHEAIYSESVFNSLTVFNHSEFSHGPLMRSCTFNIAPSFHDAKISGAADFNNAIFLNFIDESSPSNYRALKLFMKNSANFKQEAIFYCLEQRSLRKQKGLKIGEKIVSLIYDFFSNYGMNYWRPLFLLLLFNFISALLYLPFLFTRWEVYINGLFQSIQTSGRFTLFNFFSPLKVWYGRSHENVEHFFGNLSTIKEITLFFITTFQSVLSITLLTLFLLAIRRAFKLQ